MSFFKKITGLFSKKKDSGALIDQSIREHNQFIRRIEIDGKILSQIDQDALKIRPYLLWNGFIDIVALEELNELTIIQRPAALVFAYESEMQNGGHYQYFINRGLSQLRATIKALEELGASEQAEILRAAGEEARKHELAPETTEEFVAGALEGPFDSMDTRYYKCKPDLSIILEEYLKLYQAEFIIIK